MNAHGCLSNQLLIERDVFPAHALIREALLNTLTHRQAIECAQAFYQDRQLGRGVPLNPIDTMRDNFRHGSAP